MPLYRKIFGNIQDFAHPLNKSMRRGLREIMEQYPGTTYISGHEHSLQHIESDSAHDAQHFEEVTHDILVFAEKADAMLSTFVNADKNWLVKTFIGMVK